MADFNGFSSTGQHLIIPPGASDSEKLAIVIAHTELQAQQLKSLQQFASSALNQFNTLEEMQQAQKGMARQQQAADKHLDKMQLAQQEMARQQEETAADKKEIQAQIKTWTNVRRSYRRLGKWALWVGGVIVTGIGIAVAVIIEIVLSSWLKA